MAESIRIYGVDFTSAPSKNKPIALAHAVLNANKLLVSHVEAIHDWSEFERFLETSGPWRAGFDFPFSQPVQLFNAWKMEGDWLSLVSKFIGQGREAFESRLREFSINQPKGQKRYFRQTDRKAQSCSPMQLDFVPVGKMFITGAPRLAATNISILPVRPTRDTRQAVEAYPKLVACKVIGNKSYKADAKPKQTELKKSTRIELVDGLERVCSQQYGLDIVVNPQLCTSAIDDATGDTLDAILCSIQSAWSFRCQQPRNGIPLDVDVREGWIVDPELIS